MSKVARIQLIGSPIDRPYGGAAVTDQNFANILFSRDVNPFTQTQVIVANKRPGFGADTAITDATDIYAVSAYLVDSTSSVLSVVKTGANTIKHALDTSIGAEEQTVTGNNGCSRMKPFTDSSGVQNWAFTVTAASTANKKSFLWINDGSVFTEITDAQFPATTVTGQPAFLDGYLFWMTYDLGRIYNANLNAPTAYDTTSFLTVTSGDAGTGLANYRDKVVAIGKDYIEFYENVGNATGSPLQQIDHLRLKGYGVNNTNGVTDNSHRYIEAFGTIFWLNHFGADAGPGCYMLEGFQPKKISNSYMDKQLDEGVNHVIVGAVSFRGYRYLFITTGSAATNECFVYCLELNSWTRWTSTQFADALPLIVPGNLVSEIHLYSGTAVYNLDISGSGTFTDDGSAYTATIQTRNLDLGTGKRKLFNKLRLVGKDPRETSNCSVSWSFDDQQNYSTARTLNLADNDGYPYTTRLGIGRLKHSRYSR